MKLEGRTVLLGVTVLVATHDLELVERMPHRQLKLVAGQIASDSGHEGR